MELQRLTAPVAAASNAAVALKKRWVRPRPTRRCAVPAEAGAVGEEGTPGTSGRQAGGQLVERAPQPPATQAGTGGSGSNVTVEEQRSADEDQRRRDFYANVGDAIRTLREDIPLVFVRDLNYDIYREDVVFKDPNIAFHGLKNYKLIFWSLRFHGRIFFNALFVEVQRVWQPDDAQIKMRWKVYAKPRLGATDATFDGISTYRLDRTGKIFEHSVDNVQLRDPPVRNPLLYFWNYLLAPAPTAQQMPCPGSWFEDGKELATQPTLLSSSGSWDEY